MRPLKDQLIARYQYQHIRYLITFKSEFFYKSNVIVQYNIDDFLYMNLRIKTFLVLWSVFFYFLQRRHRMTIKCPYIIVQQCRNTKQSLIIQNALFPLRSENISFTKGLFPHPIITQPVPWIVMTRDIRQTTFIHQNCFSCWCAESRLSEGPGASSKLSGGRNIVWDKN